MKVVVDLKVVGSKENHNEIVVDVIVVIDVEMDDDLVVGINDYLLVLVINGVIEVVLIIEEIWIVNHIIQIGILEIFFEMKEDFNVVQINLVFGNWDVEDLVVDLVTYFHEVQVIDNLAKIKEIVLVVSRTIEVVMEVT